MGVLNCSQTLPSGKTVMNRFGLDDSVQPLVLFAANGRKPRQVPVAVLTDTALPDWLRRGSALKLYQPQTSDELYTKCLTKSTCALIVHPGALSSAQTKVIKEVHMQRRNVTFALIDTSKVSFSLQRKLPPQIPNLVVFQRPRGSTGTAAAIGAKAYKGEFVVDSLVAFVGHIAAGAVDMTVLKKVPKIYPISKASQQRRENKVDAPSSTPKRPPKSTPAPLPAEVEKDDPEFEDDSAVDGDAEELDREWERQRRKEMEEEQQAWFQEADAELTADSMATKEDEDIEEIDADQD